MQFLSVLGFLAATGMAAQVTIHNNCSTAVWLNPDSAGATGTVSFLLVNNFIFTPVTSNPTTILSSLHKRKSTLTSINLPNIPLNSPSQPPPSHLPQPTTQVTNKQTKKPIPIPTKSAWITDLKGTGNAFKLAPSRESLDKPIQFDYSVGPDGLTYYDVTDAVGNPFPLLAHGDDCAAVQCPAGPDMCKTTKSCPQDKDVHVYACP